MSKVPAFGLAQPLRFGFDDESGAGRAATPVEYSLRITLEWNEIKQRFQKTEPRY
jgi:hypothetical protein